mgnify:CR=1 FL=1
MAASSPRPSWAWARQAPVLSPSRASPTVWPAPARRRTRSSCSRSWAGVNRNSARRPRPSASWAHWAPSLPQRQARYSSPPLGGAAGGSGVRPLARAARLQVVVQAVGQQVVRGADKALVAEDGGAAGQPDQGAVAGADAGAADGPEVFAQPVDGQEHHVVAHHGPGGDGIAGQVRGGVSARVEQHAPRLVRDQHGALDGAVDGLYAQVDVGVQVGQHGVGHVQHAAHRPGHIVRGDVGEHGVVHRHQVHAARRPRAKGGYGHAQGQRRRQQDQDEPFCPVRHAASLLSQLLFGRLTRGGAPPASAGPCPGRGWRPGSGCGPGGPAFRPG